MLLYVWILNIKNHHVVKLPCHITKKLCKFYIWYHQVSSYFLTTLFQYDVIRYLYYFLAALGPTIQPYLWWKRLVTPSFHLSLKSFTHFIFHITYLRQIPDPASNGPVCDIFCSRHAAALYWVRLSKGKLMLKEMAVIVGIMLMTMIMLMMVGQWW